MLERYLDPVERRARDELVELVGLKDDLDYHYALQAVLKRWLFVHIPLTYAMLVLAGVHGFLAVAFSGA